MPEHLLITGATGLLGQAFLKAAADLGINFAGLARSGADIECDLTNDEAVEAALAAYRPTTVINTAAMTSLEDCEKNADAAWRINARAVAVLAEYCRKKDVKLVQISTDHYYTGDRTMKHDEISPVTLVNEYARTKYAGEAFALACPGALVVRTNIVGWRGWPERPTFFEWAVESLEVRRPMTLFDDFYSSAIDAGTCARHVLRLAQDNGVGVINVAGGEVTSKESFIRATAHALGINADWVETGSVVGLSPPRAESLGLDVARAETRLGCTMPIMDQIIDTLFAERP